MLLATIVVLKSGCKGTAFFRDGQIFGGILFNKLQNPSFRM